LEAVNRGEVGLSPSMLAKILGEFQRPEAATARVGAGQEELTTRELEVLQQVASGASNREIAEALTITDNTVKKHLQSILAKLHLQNRVQAAVYAVREGLVEEGNTKNTPIG
jgi:DNA-binding NarL/FixJ family response regulator